MKKLCLIAGLPVVALMMCVFVQSCAQTEDHQSEQSIALTEADLVVASPEFQAYSHALSSNAGYIGSSYENLSEEDRKKFDGLVAAYKNDPSIDFFTEGGRILKYNMKGGFDMIEDLRSKVNFPEGVSTEDLIRAIMRYDHLAVTHTRYYDPAEEPEKEMLQLCLNHCESMYRVLLIECNRINNSNNREKTACFEMAYERNHFCKQNCYDEYYKLTDY